MKNYLNAVTAKYSNKLKSTMSSNRNMELIQLSSEIVYSVVDGFMKFHQDWFRVPKLDC